MNPKRKKTWLVLLVILAWSSLSFGGAIHEAAKNGDVNAIRALIGSNHDLVFSKDERGWTPLHWAALVRSPAAKVAHQHAVGMLLAYKADVNARAYDGTTPLHVAAQGEVDCDSGSAGSGISGGFGNKEVVSFLLGAGAKVQATDNRGWTPLHSAANAGCLTVTQILVGRLLLPDREQTPIAHMVDANVNTRAKDGITPFGLAIKGRHTEVAQYLRIYGGHE